MVMKMSVVGFHEHPLLKRCHKNDFLHSRAEKGNAVAGSVREQNLRRDGSVSCPLRTLYQ